MVTVKVLERRDGASLVVGVVLGIFVATAVAAFSDRIGRVLSGLGNHSNSDWKANYLFPVVLFLVELVILEIGVRLFIYLREAYLRAR